MDSAALTATALGSTALIIACIGLGGGALISSRGPTVSASGNLVRIIKYIWQSPFVRAVCFEFSDGSAYILECLSPYVLAVHAYIAEKLEPIKQAMRAWAVRKLIALRDHLVAKLVATARTLLRWEKKYRRVKPEGTWKNFRKLVRIVKVWEPLPYDLMLTTQPWGLRTKPFQPRSGLVGVCLRFRAGFLNGRLHRRDPWTLEPREYSITEYFPPEVDGTLRLEPIRKRFGVEELEFLVPGRYDPFYPADEDRLSAVALHNLTQQLGYVNVVEREDRYCQMRRRFRQWLRGSRFYYTVRWVCYLVVVLSLLGSVYYTTTLAVEAWPQHKRFMVFCGVVAFLSGYLCYIKYTQAPYGPYRRWHFFPQRRARSWLPNDFLYYMFL